MQENQIIPQLRSATAADSEFAYQVKKAAIKEDLEMSYGWEEAYQREFHRRNFDLNNSYIITFRGVRLGWLSYYVNDKQISLQEIYVHPDYQHRGIGAYLINQLMQEAQEKGIPIYVQVLKVLPAKRMFERLGFRVVGETYTHHRLVRRYQSLTPIAT